MVYHLARRFDEAIEAARKTVHLDDTYALGHWVLGLAAEAIDETGMALEAFNRARELTRDSVLMRAQVANALARSGEEKAAETLLSTLVRRDDQGFETGSLVPFICAGAYAALGRTETALDLLYQAYREREPHLIYVNVEPRMDPLRGEPRFRQLVIRMGLSPTRV
jgi:tetratricopeptide (TPR) repeat protein